MHGEGTRGEGRQKGRVCVNGEAMRGECAQVEGQEGRVTCMCEWREYREGMYECGGGMRGGVCVSVEGA